MSIKDIIKKSILSNYSNNNFSVKEIALMLIMAAIIGMFIYFIYRYIVKEGFYSKAFNVSLIVLTVITATIIITIQTSIVVSLGMVGALSIVRFRTAVKNPLDLVFAFWAISVGIVVGTGMVILAAIMSLVIALILIIFMSLVEGKKTRLIHVRGTFNTEDISKLVMSYDGKAKIQSENYTKDVADILFMTKIKDVSALISDLRNSEGVTGVSAIEHTEGQF